MAIFSQLDFRACIDADDPDDYRPRSTWAVASDPEASPSSFVEGSVVVVDRVAPGDQIPLHTHPIDEVVVVEGAAAELRLGDEVKTVPPGAVMFVPRGTPHGARPVGPEVTLIGFFAESTVETTYLERNPAPGTDGQAPRQNTRLDVRAETEARAGGKSPPARP